MNSSDAPIVVEQTFESTTAQLWEAITELNQMRKWFFENVKSFEPKEGFQTRFMVENEGRKFPHLWKVVAVEPGKRIKYNWKYEGYPGNSFVTFEVGVGEDGCQLTLTHQITESFPTNIPEFTRENCQEGWNWFIKVRLKAYLEGSKKTSHN